jgi:hypothetical protein
MLALAICRLVVIIIDSGVYITFVDQKINSLPASFQSRIN